MLQQCKCSYLGTVGVVGVRRIQHCRVLDQRVHLFVQYVEVTSVVELERTRHRKSVHPGEYGIEEVAGNVEALISSPQLHHVTAGAVAQKTEFNSSHDDFSQTFVCARKSESDSPIEAELRELDCVTRNHPAGPSW